jgi:hypothetical protein
VSEVTWFVRVVLEKRGLRLRKSSGTPERVLLCVLLVALTASFVYGWNLDPSTAGADSWADQGLYTRTATDLANWRLPEAGAFHYQVTYPLLGALGSFLFPNDPFLPISFVLFLGSAGFLYLGARPRIGWIWSAVFVIAVFAWDLVGRTFNYASELFVIPWNNQIAFFALAFFFWLLGNRIELPAVVPDWIFGVAGLITGITVGAREEMALFVLPLFGYVLVKTRASPARWAMGIGGAVAGYLPHLVIKVLVLGTAAGSGRQAGYLDLLTGYMSWDRLSINVLDVLVDSSARGLDADRVALLQAAPWLWLSPIGLALYLTVSNRDKPMQLFILVSVALCLFYLAGPNMSLQKLRFHCLRYIAPAFIALNFGTIYSLYFASGRLRALLNNKSGPSSEVSSSS